MHGMFSYRGREFAVVAVEANPGEYVATLSEWVGDNWMPRDLPCGSRDARHAEASAFLEAVSAGIALVDAAAACLRTSA